MEGGAHGRGEASGRAVATRACDAHDAEARRRYPGRRLALLGHQGPDLGPAGGRGRRAVHGRGRDRPLQALARRRGGRGRAASDARLPGLALLRGEVRAARHRRGPAGLRRDARRDAARTRRIGPPVNLFASGLSQWARRTMFGVWFERQAFGDWAWTGRRTRRSPRGAGTRTSRPLSRRRTTYPPRAQERADGSFSRSTRR